MRITRNRLDNAPSLYRLVRFIRNIDEHYCEVEQHVRDKFGLQT